MCSQAVNEFLDPVRLQQRDTLKVYNYFSVF